MIELPDGKVSRTLPEQVGFLSNQVKEIFKFIDGINVQDNVVAVENIETPLTAKELVIVNRDVAFLVYSGQLYIKKSVSGSTAYFDVVFSITGGTTITFNSSEIQVNLTNGGMSLVSNTSATYSTTQIDLKADKTYVDNQLALKASLAGANFSGAVGALTLKQTLANKVFNGNWNFNSSTYELTDIYTRVEEINSVLYCIANIKLKRVATDGNMYYIANFSVSLDEETASKVYDMQGNSLLTSPNQAVLITGVPATVYDSIQGDNPGASTSKVVFLNILHLPGGTKLLGLYFSSMGSPITQGSELYLTARIPLTLI